MTNATKIEWTDTTWNPTVGCSRVSVGCRNCYAERMAGRLANMKLQSEPYSRVVKWDTDGQDIVMLPQWNGEVVTLDDRLTEPLSWRKPRRVFVDSMSDLFHEAVPFEFQVKVFQVTQCARHHRYQILTKRPHIMAERTPKIIEALDRQSGQSEDFPYPPLNGKAPDNVWLGTSVEDQATADERIPHLLRCPAAVRFLSCEPLLGPLDVSEYLRCPECRWEGEPDEVPDDVVASSTCTPCGHGETCPCIHWVIVGGESGPDARPMHPDWVRSIRDQCVAAGVPFFFKQWGQWAPDCLCLTRRAHARTPRPKPGLPGVMFECGKKAAGRVLDGRTWDEMPEVTHG